MEERGMTRVRYTASVLVYCIDIHILQARQVFKSISFVRMYKHRLMPGCMFHHKGICCHTCLMLV